MKSLCIGDNHRDEIRDSLVVSFWEFMLDLEGKVAFISGAAQGIGSITAQKFVSEGAKVIAVDQQKDKLDLLSSKGKGSIYGIQADLGNEKEIEIAFKTGCEHFGGLDILLNCAVLRSNMPLKDLDEQAITPALDVGIKGNILCSKFSSEYMKKRGGGVIVNMSSFYARTPAKERIVYVAVKSATEGLTRALAVELAEYNIRVNAIAPGPILTDRRVELGHGKDGDMEKRYENLLMKRFGRVEEIIEAILFLVTEKSSYITGQTIVVDGGITIA